MADGNPALTAPLPAEEEEDFDLLGPPTSPQGITGSRKPWREWPDGSAHAAGSAVGSPQQPLFPPQQAPYPQPFGPPTSPTFVPGVAAPAVNVGLDPNFQTRKLELMRSSQRSMEQNSRLIELMERRFTAEENRREDLKTTNIQDFGRKDHIYSIFRCRDNKENSSQSILTDTGPESLIALA